MAITFYNTTPKVWIERPQLGTYAASVSQLWALIEQEISYIFIKLSGSNFALGAAFVTVISIRNRLKMVKKLVDRFLNRSDREEFKKLADRIERMSRRRSVVVHGLWSIRKEEPDAVFLHNPYPRTQNEAEPVAYRKANFKRLILDLEALRADVGKVPRPSLRFGESRAVSAILLACERIGATFRDRSFANGSRKVYDQGMAGRPTIYNERKAERLLSAIAGGASIREACELVGYKLSTVAMWAVRDTPSGFRTKYFTAFAARSLVDLDDARAGLVEVADSNSMAQVQARRSVADLARFQATKLISELGDRINLEVERPLISIYLPEKGARQPGAGARVLDHDARVLDHEPQQQQLEDGSES